MQSPADRLLQIEKEGGWDEYRLLVINLLNTIQHDQRELAASVQRISENYNTMKLDIVREITASTARRALIGASVPMFISLIALAVNLWLATRPHT